MIDIGTNLKKVLLVLILVVLLVVFAFYDINGAARTAVLAIIGFILGMELRHLDKS